MNHEWDSRRWKDRSWGSRTIKKVHLFFFTKIRCFFLSRMTLEIRSDDDAEFFLQHIRSTKSKVNFFYRNEEKRSIDTAEYIFLRFYRNINFRFFECPLINLKRKKFISWFLYTKKPWIFTFEIEKRIVGHLIRETRFIRDIRFDNVRAIMLCYPTQSQSTRRDGDFITNATSSFYTISKISSWW